MSERMIVACPECQTRFVAPLEKFLPSGRKVRCAKCGHSWFQAVEGARSHAPDMGAEPDAGTVEPASHEADADVEAEPAESAGRASPASLIERAEQRRTERDRDEKAEMAATAGLAGGAAATTAVALEDSDARADGAADPATHDHRVTKAREESIARTEEPATARAVQEQPAATASETSIRETDARTETGAYRDDDDSRSGGGFLRGLFYLIAAGLILAVVGYLFKDDIAARVPALDAPLTALEQNVDHALGSFVGDGTNLQIEGVKYDIEEKDDETALLLAASVVNSGETSVPAPRLDVTIFGANDAVLEERTISTEDLSERIAPNSSVPYYMRLPFPPENFDRVEVDFAD